MSWRNFLILGLVVASRASASEIGPHHAECALLDKIGPLALAPDKRDAALTVLERIATATNPAEKSSMERALGMELPDFSQRGYLEFAVRACALRAIGKTGLSEAVDFLSAYSPAESVNIATAPLWPAADIALQEARLGRISDARGKSQFLQNVLTAPHDAKSNTAVINWAVDQLCDSGDESALPQIRAALKGMWGRDSRGAERVRFCESRVEVLGRNADRAQALATVFESAARIEGGAEGEELIRWAVRQISDLHTPSADAEIERIAEQLSISAKTFATDIKLEQLSRTLSAIRDSRRNMPSQR